MQYHNLNRVGYSAFPNKYTWKEMRNYSDNEDLTSDIILPGPTSIDVAMMKLDSALRVSLHKTPRLELRPEYYPRPTGNALQV